MQERADYGLSTGEHAVDEVDNPITETVIYRQRVDPGVATDQVASSTNVVGLPVARDLLLNLVSEPSASDSAASRCAPPASPARRDGSRGFVRCGGYGLRPFLR